MKYCPQCQTSYTDDSLKFCKRDGARLESATDLPTVNFGEEATVVSSRQVEPIRVPIESNSFPQQNWQQQSAPLPPPQIIAAAPAQKKSKTGLAVALTALGMLLLFGLIGAGAFIFMRERKPEIAANVNVSNAPIVNRSPNANANANAANQNANLSTPTPAPTPTPKPTLDPKQAKTVTEDVKNVLDDWKSSTENRDIDAHINQYADTVDYYKGGKVSQQKIRADRQHAFDSYDSISVDISNVKITPDASGDKATAVFDKEWTFEGEDAFTSGKVQQQLSFAKIGGNWKITGEKDLKLYYKN